jgi:hypothetical protein
LNEEQYKQVCEACDRVLEMPGSTLERMSIPWLHVLREHPSFLKGYEGLFAASTTLSHVVKAIAAKTRSSAGWLRQLWGALRSDGEPWKASQALSGPVDVLFVSHLLNGADAGKAVDFYFGNLPELLRAEGRRVVVALIDHTATPDKSRVQRWDASACPRVLLSDTLGLSGELSLWRRLRRESSRLASLSRRESPGFLKKVFARASLEAMSGGARTTLRMSVQVSRLVASIQPKLMIVTYEGHAWERVAFAAAREVSAGVQCAGYQHAAIFRLQHGALRKLGSAFDPDLILTAGSVSKGQVENSPGMQGIPVRVLGSNRAFVGPERAEAGDPGRGDDFDPRLAAAGKACLVLPEGIISECLVLFEFSLSCAELMPNMRFIWRLHPLVRFESLVAQNPKLRKLPQNVELSTATIEDDIACAAYALYRGSTAIVKAVCANVRPVYLALPDEMTIDPLYQLGSWRESVTNPEQFSSLVHGDPLEAGESEGQTLAVRYCGNFYMPIDSAVVIDILQSKEKS